jgi:16S rRNA C1402 N4-methylase RsmH
MFTNSFSRTIALSRKSTYASVFDHGHANFSSFGGPACNDYQVDKSAIQRAPTIFCSTLVTDLFEREASCKPLTLLDMTFGNGANTKEALSQLNNRTIKVYAADCDPAAIEIANGLIGSGKYTREQLIPIKSRFSDISFHLETLGIEAESLSGILIDTVIPTCQWVDRTRQCPLNLIKDPEGTGVPTGSQVLQHIQEVPLLKLLKIYGGLKQNAQHVATSILESRYMHNKFETFHDLLDVHRTAVRHGSKETFLDEDEEQKLAAEWMSKTVTALRMFINDELNQLDFAINNVATKYLKPGGVLAVMVHTPAEKKVVTKCLTEIDLPHAPDHDWSAEVQLFNI